jgi:glycine cleavage system H lipoate-binding protein/ABC-type phosphate transport system substrate-binding protein
MKRATILLISLLLFGYTNMKGIGPVTENSPLQVDSMRVLSTPDLFELSNIWANEYNRLFPELKINVISVSGNMIADQLSKEGNIGFISHGSSPEVESKSEWKVVIGRDVIVPVINTENPYMNEITQQGVSPEVLGRFLGNKDSGTWGNLLNIKQKRSANLYYTADESIEAALVEFLQTEGINARGKRLNSPEELIKEVQKDPYAIGFCKMVNIFDFKNQKIADKISVLPIDRNGNGTLDYNENIYNDYNVFARGIWIGKYPKALFSNIYSVSAKQPESPAELAFLKWVLTDGQKYLYDNGYSDLLVSERQTRVDKLFNAEIVSAAAPVNRSFLRMFVLLLGAIVVVLISIEASVRFFRRQKAAGHIAPANFKSRLDENGLLVPEGLFFDTTHTWAYMEQNGVVKVGIDDFLQHITGKLTRIKVKSNGEKIKKGEHVLSIIRNGKQLNLYSPVSGVIKEYNKNLDTDSSVINSSPYNEGWIYKIAPTNWLKEIQLLFMADKYKEWLKNEFTRIKDFLAIALSSDKEKYAQVILQDGGELADSVLADLGPEIWEDFQTQFIDSSR